MIIELSSLDMKVKNLHNIGTEVKVDFDYSQTNKNEYIFTFNVYVGFSSTNDYRYLMKIEYLAKLDESRVIDHNFIEKVIDIFVSELCRILITVDSILIKR